VKGRAHPEGVRYAEKILNWGLRPRLSDLMQLRPNPSRPGRRAGPRNCDVMKSFGLVAKRHEAALLACDVDLDRVARVIGIQLDHSAGPERP
jgi:hypothetical protein